MALLGSLGPTFPAEVGLRLLLSPLCSNVVIRTACCTVGIGLPAYSTFKAIENKDQNGQEKWLVYWAAYGSVSVVEIFSDKILSWFPFYYHVKFAFLVWLQFPSGNGSRHLYARHLRPFLLKHQAKIDQLLSSLSSECDKFITTHQREIQFFRALIVRCAMAANQVVKDITGPVQTAGRRTIEGPNAPEGQQTHDLDSVSDN